MSKLTNGQRVVTTGLSLVGTREATHRNDGEPVETWQREAALAHGLAEHTYNPARRGGQIVGDGAPWCAIGVKHIFKAAGVELDPMLSHPFTGFICNRADQLGGLAPRGLAPAGSLGIKSGVHVFIVVHDRGNGVLETVECNSSDMVRTNLRNKSDWRIIVPPGIEDHVDERPAFAMVTRYGFDDLDVMPALYGGWRTEHDRNVKMNGYQLAHPGMWAAPVMLDGKASPFAFRAAPQGTYGMPWRFGGWASKAIREHEQAGYAAAAGHTNLRDWSKQVRVPAFAADGAVDTSSKTT